MIDKLNIGAGRWLLDGWARLDNPCPHYTFPVPPDILQDLTKLERIPLEDNSLKLVFSSHLIEHLFDDQVSHLLREVKRMLEPGGIFRIVCPDIYYYIKEYEAQRLSAREFAISFNAGLPSRIDDKMVEQLISESGCKGVARYSASSNPRDTNARFPMRHVNWFDGKKLIDMLCKAGFSDAQICQEGNSKSREMRDLEHFDYSHQFMSLYVEAIK